MAVTVYGAICKTPEGRATIGRRPALAAWWDKVADRPSVAATRSPLEH